jgi:hypothetical protein
MPRRCHRTSSKINMKRGNFNFVFHLITERLTPNFSIVFRSEVNNLADQVAI